MYCKSMFKSLQCPTVLWPRRSPSFEWMMPVVKPCIIAAVIILKILSCIC
ncbi:hypothetical protein P4O66_020242 [Electrophorus voltai]|uniref:Uncharacterized protein n=1 Tax=Electrophorus voltai TaxID=2609070 RepID=A0AAD8ZS83_9TELE|nr:hypothetical protein P4O66_020242 [Electrophorus voltai]